MEGVDDEQSGELMPLSEDRLNAPTLYAGFPPAMTLEELKSYPEYYETERSDVEYLSSGVYWTCQCCGVDVELTVAEFVELTAHRSP
jgi:hypothetical protein